MYPLEIRNLLQKLGERVPQDSQLILVGGSALALLGNPRSTIDLDFWGDDLSPNPLHRLIIQVASELKIHAEAVPLERFIPLPDGSARRNLRMGKFGNLEVFVADPYSIALSKLDRGFDTDLDDIVFLVRNGYVDVQELERITKAALVRAQEFDLSPEILDHFSELKRRLN